MLILIPFALPLSQRSKRCKFAGRVTCLRYLNYLHMGNPILADVLGSNLLLAAFLDRQ
jgi:hypothetical protein